ncbi:MAG TPA: family 43 glycosylhydrolase [Polyangiaceae bacterium]|nr:family 43 glycosylhydrolase [Polyangiaceae bacterium]
MCASCGDNGSSGGSQRGAGSGGSGAVTASGGAAGTSGSAGSGAGPASSGGAAAASGTSGTSGTPSTGGTAGVTASGGDGGSAPNGGAAGASGGASASGGTAGASGRATGGASGRATGGAGATGGTAGASGASSGALIQNDRFWKDTSGNPIYSQGGGVIQVSDTYYWYGVKYDGAPTYEANPTKDNSDTSFNAVTCYSSQDLVNWKFEGNALAASDSGTEVAGASWLGRLGVAYNKNTQKYVLVSQYQGTAGDGELFATSDTPTGAFTFDHIQATVENVANQTTGDQTLFIDDDGSAYVVCSSSMGRSNLYVAPLHAADYLSVDAATRIFGGPGREGNAMFKYADHYYFCSSDLHGWNASHTYCISATNIMGPYGTEFVLANTDADFSHVTQTGFFVTVQGSAQQTVIFAGDRWADFAGNGLGFNQWMPLTFDGTTPAFQSLSEWSLDAVTGEWSVGPDNNYALNPSFEADRVTMTVPAGWTTSSTTSGATPYTNASGGHTGNWNWTLSNGADYQATLEQTAKNLPNGTYTLSAWVKSSGGQAVANLYAADFGGSDLNASLTKALSAWTEVSLTGIAVTNGSCRFGVTTTASASQSLHLDDFSLVRTGP